MAILNGWKEIATYLGYGVRTVQRWELAGLPVHRVRRGTKGSLFAFTEELDAWRHASPMKYADEIAELKAEVESLKEQVASLQKQLESRPKAFVASQKSN